MTDKIDDVDDLLRGAMKVLDSEVPSDYFEALPKRVQARLEGNGMHTQSSMEHNVDDTNPVMMQDFGTGNASEARSETDADRAPTSVEKDERDEDSGLHDIRNLASSTKARLSKKMTAVTVDEDVLASSSAGWKAVALPDPAAMIALPEVSEMPSLKELNKQEAKRAKRESKRPPMAHESAPMAAAVSAPAVDELAARRAEASAAPATSISSMPSFGSSMLGAQSQKKSKKGLLAVVGVGLAAAAGVAIFVGTQGKAKEAAAPAVATNTAAPVEQKAEEKAVAPDPAPAAAAAPEIAAAGSAAPADEAAADVDAKEDAGEAKRAAMKKPAPAKAAKQDDKVEIDLSKDQPKTPPAKDKVAKPSLPTTQGGGEPEQSFDDLLKEAGVSDKKKVDKPKLEKKSLSSDDIRKGMQSAQSKALACYAGTQGTASVKLTVAPSGQVQKVTVSGVFAGTPVGACVQSAVQGITFPAWDGGPQSISYSYLLAE